MSDPLSKPVAENATGSSSNAAAGATASAAGSAGSAPKKPLPEGNPALRMLGLPRLRLPSRNWMIFLGITGSFASAVMYDKWQTRKIREKWCKLVAHVAQEPIDTKTLPRRLTIYLSAPPGDGLRSAREHFHEYVKPVLVAAAMDWDVVEGRKEGDVRFKTAERIRRRRKRGGEGEVVPETEQHSVEQVRQEHGTSEYPGVAGDLVVGRHTWKEYIRGLHEGWLGPPDAPPVAEAGSNEQSGLQSNLELPVASPTAIPADLPHEAPVEATNDSTSTESSESQTETAEEKKEEKKEEEEEEEEKPKPRQPPPYITPEAYASATPSPLMPEIVGPSAPIRFPHLLGFRNTPIRIYRFLNRRKLMDGVGQEVASAILANHRPYGVTAAADDSSPSATGSAVPEQSETLGFEERDWWKTVYQPRKELEESVLIEPMVFDDRISSRMRQFQLTAEDKSKSEDLSDQALEGSRRQSVVM